MQELANSLIDTGIQCWTCPIFDGMFAIVSNTAAAAYQRLCLFSVVIFCVLLVFYALNAVWQNIKNGAKESLFDKALRPVLIKSLIALSILSMGLIVPRLISAITFEPVAVATLQCTKMLLPPDYVIPTYGNAIDIGTNGFFNPALRDTIIQILEASVANFQVYIKIGVAIINEAFSLSALSSIASLIKHIIICFIGIFLTYNFAKWFVKYSFCFVDVIFAMAMFSFFFPLSVVLFIFRGAKDAPGWMKDLGSKLGGGQIKKLINAIASMTSYILTYTIIMLIIRGFLNAKGVDTDSIQASAKSIFDFDLENSDAVQITFAGAIVLVYVINYIEKQIPKVTNKILSTFNIQPENKLSEEMGKDTLQLTRIVFEKTKDLATTVISAANGNNTKKTDDSSSTGDKKD